MTVHPAVARSENFNICIFFCYRNYEDKIFQNLQDNNHHAALHLYTSFDDRDNNVMATWASERQTTASYIYSASSCQSQTLYLYLHGDGMYSTEIKKKSLMVAFSGTIYRSNLSNFDLNILDKISRSHFVGKSKLKSRFLYNFLSNQIQRGLLHIM